jgi:hypothetical protein
VKYKDGDPFNCRESNLLAVGPNSVMLTSDCVVMLLCDTRGRYAGTTILDYDTWNSISSYRWYLGKNGYVAHTKLGYLHHQVTGKPPSGMVVDHINRNKLDNRAANLRVVTPLENIRNQERYLNGKEDNN